MEAGFKAAEVVNQLEGTDVFFQVIIVVRKQPEN